MWWRSVAPVCVCVCVCVWLTLLCRLCCCCCPLQGVLTYLLSSAASDSFAINATTGDVTLTKQLLTPAAVQLLAVARDARDECNEYSDGQWSKRDGACASTPATIDVSCCDVDMFGVALECVVCVLREAALLAVLTLVQCCWCCRLTDYRCGAAGLPERHQRIRGHRRHRAHRLVGLTSNFCEQSVVVERKG